MRCPQYIFAFLLLGCNSAKDKEIAELKARLAQAEKPSLAAALNPQPPIVKPTTSEAHHSADDTCLQLGTLSSEGIGIDMTAERLSAWCAAFGPGLSLEQRDRAAMALLRYLHRSLTGLTYNLGIHFVNDRGHFRDLDELLILFSRKVNRANRIKQMGLADINDGPGPEAAYAIFGYDVSAVSRILAGAAPPKRPAAPPIGLAESWVNLSTPEAIARYSAWREEISDGYTDEQARRLIADFIGKTLRRPVGIYWYNHQLRIFDDHGHLDDLAAIVAANQREAGRKATLQDNYGPELGAAVWNFKHARYAARLEKHLHPSAPSAAGAAP